MIWEIWWAWVAAGIALAIFEVIAPGFVFLGFAIGAVAVGVLVAVGLGLTLAWSLLVLAVVSVIAWVLLRQVFGIRRGQKRTFDRDINED
jgi:inner membrane protein